MTLCLYGNNTYLSSYNLNRITGGGADGKIRMADNWKKAAFHYPVHSNLRQGNGFSGLVSECNTAEMYEGLFKKTREFKAD